MIQENTIIKITPRAHNSGLTEQMHRHEYVLPCSRSLCASSGPDDDDDSDSFSESFDFSEVSMSSDCSDFSKSVSFMLKKKRINVN